jgi:proton-dependent oligopeptide transporter, POT family
MNPQPRALYLLNFVSMWECFSYYGMRALLVLYMVQELDFTDSQAFTIYTVYITSLEFGGIFGGLIADRFLGLKKTIEMGGWIIVLGHASLALSGSQTAFFMALAIIVIGTSLFRTNVSALLGKFYEQDDQRRDAGYTLYYAGINVGGFLAAIVCGFAGEWYGWHAGFGLAAAGMLFGCLAFRIGKNTLKYKEERNQRENFPVSQMFRLIWHSKGLKLLSIYIIFLVLFYGCEEQLGSTLVLFAERHIDRKTIFGMIPAASLITVNPLTILVVGPFFYRLMQKVPLNGMSKIAISFAFLGSAFFLLTLGCVTAPQGNQIPVIYAIGSIFLIGIGELFIGPTVFAEASKAAPRGLSGVVMGLVTLGFSFANMASGFLSQLMAVSDETMSLPIYSRGFSIIGLSALFLTLFILKINQQRKVEI